MRLFTAIEIPEEVRAALSALDGGTLDAHWVDEETYHLTLRYIGDVDPHMAEDIDAALAAIAFKPFSVQLQTVGTFGDPPRVLWAGVAHADRLLALVEKVDTALTRLKVDFERRRYAPHVTLARFRDPPVKALHQFIQTHSAFVSEPFPVTRFVLYSSERTHAGPIYTPERYYLA